MGKPPKKEKDLDLLVSVNGDPAITITAKPNNHLEKLIPLALDASGNVGRPPEDWDLKNEAGDVLDLKKKIEEFGFASGTLLFLTLKAGEAG
jgi:hypothetical protein